MGIRYVVVSRGGDLQGEINKWKTLGYKVVARLTSGGNVVLECRRAA